jgi:23S rRNA (cytosine1962-C5)-methyltransferase
MNKYQLIDSGDGLKFERFGQYSLIRPSPTALWKKQHPDRWEFADAQFSRETKNGWSYKRKLPKEWICEIDGIRLKVAPTDFGHLGVFPEHFALWQNLQSLLSADSKVLNLFGYSGSATLAFARAGAHICHQDVSKGMVDWARDNAALNELQDAPIRWIVDDPLKFLRKETRREVAYDAILVDPPTFGSGMKGVFKMEDDLLPLLELCKSRLSNQPRFVVVYNHAPHVTPLGLSNLAQQIFPEASIVVGEMSLQSEGALPIPTGSFVKVLWTK